ncbi:MAG: hypothetical protein ABIO85_06635 [Sphingomicrobium sp.]
MRIIVSLIAGVGQAGTRRQCPDIAAKGNSAGTIQRTDYQHCIALAMCDPIS